MTEGYHLIPSGFFKLDVNINYFMQFYRSVTINLLKIISNSQKKIGTIPAFIYYSNKVYFFISLILIVYKSPAA